MGPYSINEREPHAFFSRDLLKYWLEPIQGHIVDLELQSNSYWGYIPKCDLRDIHFPKLKALTLGKMTFTHDWQLEWILSHGHTLTQLTLEDCPIINEIWIGHTLDAEHYPVFNVGGRLDWKRETYDTTYWKFETRRHHCFRAMQFGLPHLRKFWCGFHVEWDQYYTGGHDREWLKAAVAGVIPSNYGAFFSDSCLDVWDTNHFDSKGDISGEGLDPAQLYPQCQEEDGKALGELVETVRGR